MPDRISTGEVARDLADFKDAIRREFDGQFRFLNGLVLALLTLVLGGGVGGGIAMYRQIGNLESSVVAQGRDLAAVKERVERIEDKVIPGLQQVLVGKLDQLLLRGGGGQPTLITPAIALTVGDRATIRALLGLKDFPVRQPKYALGEVLTEKLQPFPKEVEQKIPSIQGMNYWIDPAGWVLIADSANRVVAIV
jgi:hypothetical protein